jgi:hypothetical protein
VIRVALIVAMLCAVASAETRRVAVVVGNNAGNQDETPLRYAELDAGKLARVLVELGGVPAADLFLLEGKDLAALQDTLSRAKAKIAGYRAHLDRVVVIFYFSGHSDGIALELGHDRYAFSALRDWLKATGADVRLAVLDSCKSGALLAAKGGTPGPAFHIRLTDELSSTGEALLTSSAADESALESREIGGSFFTHHLVSGLRGAADSSGDGRVTLTEAYQYAYKHTIATSGATLAGPQHPAYDYRLSGEGELILTELARPSAAFTLPDGFDRALVIDVGHDQVIAELGRGDPTRIAVVPGRYAVRAWKAGRTFEGRLAVAANEQHAVRWDELGATTLSVSTAKGDEPVLRSIAFDVGGGARAGIASELTALESVRVGVRWSALSLAVDVASRRDGALRETDALVFAGYRFGVASGGLRASIGLEVGGGVIVQSIGGRSTSGVGAAGPIGEVSYAITPRLAVAANAQVPAALLKRDGKLAIMALPAAWLGVVITP